MKRIISLKDFAATGLFGSFEIGANKTAVIDTLGDDWDFADFQNTFILRYGWYEFYFLTATEKLFGIQNDSFPYTKSRLFFENDRIIIHPWFLPQKQTFSLKEVRKILLDEKLSFSQKPYIVGESELLVFDSGVYFSFERGDDAAAEQTDAYILNGLRIFT